MTGANFPALDGSNPPYPPVSNVDSSLADSPGFTINPFVPVVGKKLYSDVKDAVSSDQFTDWLMFTPDKGGIAVPIETLSWSYSGHATGGQNTWKLVKTDPKATNGVATTTFPKWVDNINSNQWVHNP